MVFPIRQKGVSPLLLPTSMLQLPRCLVRICNLFHKDNQLKGINDSQGCEGIGRVLAHEKAIDNVVKCLNQLCQHDGRSSFQENASDGGSTEEFVLIFGCHKMSSTFCFAGVVFDTVDCKV